MCRFNFDSSCFKRDFRVSKNFQPLYFIPLCAEITNIEQEETLEQAKTKSGDDCYDVLFSKITKSWSAKPIKDTKSLDVFSNLVDLTEKSVIEKKN